MLAQINHHISSAGFGEIIIWIIIIAACIGVAFVAIRYFKIPIPEWFWHIVMIVVVACVAIFAIRFLLTM